MSSKRKSVGRSLSRSLAELRRLRARHLRRLKIESIVPLGDAADARQPRALTFVMSTADTDTLGTLRFAIEYADGHPNSTITFELPGSGIQIIHLTSQLPTISAPVTINGYSQPGASVNDQATSDDANILVQIDGGAFEFDGLTITTSDSVIEGLAIGNFDFPPSGTGSSGVIHLTGSGDAKNMSPRATSSPATSSGSAPATTRDSWSTAGPRPTRSAGPPRPTET